MSARAFTATCPECRTVHEFTWASCRAGGEDRDCACGTVLRVAPAGSVPRRRRGDDATGFVPLEDAAL